MKKILLLSLLGIGLSGCVTTEFNYVPPSDYPKINTIKTFDKNKKEVWTSLVEALSNNFFVINNIDQESGFINISYSGKADDYVDCGVISSYVKNLRGERYYEFYVATPNSIYEKTPTHKVKHSSNLSGRINLFVSEDGGKTTVSINVKYIVTIDSVSEILKFNYYTNNLIPHYSTETNVYSFNSNGKDMKNDGSMCLATGLLEKEILNFIK